MPGPCTFHPDVEGTGVCLRCGALLCDACVLHEGGYAYCRPCYREAKLEALGEGSREAVAPEGEGAAAAASSAERPHACPTCGERWARPYCPLCMRAFGEPEARRETAEIPPPPAEPTAPLRRERPPPFGRYLVSNAWGAVRRPGALFAGLAERPDVAYPVAYLWTIALPPLVASLWLRRGDWVALWAKGTPYAVAAVAGVPLGAAAFVACLWWYGSMLRGRVDGGTALRIAAFAATPLALYPLPYAGAASALWAGALVVVGLARAGRMSPVRAAAATLSAALTVWIAKTAYVRLITGLIAYEAGDAVWRVPVSPPS